MRTRLAKQDFKVTRSGAIQRYGNYIDLGTCIVSRNLNLITLRGSARLDMLALISAADKFDMKDNVSGTQRDLDSEHADACYRYAEESIDIPPQEEARAFPEVMLNVREMSAVEFYNLDDPGELYEISSYTSDDDVPQPIVGFRVNLERLELPHPDKNPSISRFDGNHRLSGMDRNVEQFFSRREPAATFEVPFVPYSLFVGLESIEEKRLFNVINNEHKGMEPALLDTQIFDLTSEDKLKTDIKLLPLWLARRLSEDSNAFSGMVFLGGATKGVKRSGMRLPLRINSLRSAMSIMLKTGGVEMKPIIDEPELLLTCTNNYWSAVAEVFPQAWKDKREFILLQSIGLNGFAMLAGKLIKDALESSTTNLHKEDFVAQLRVLSRGVTLNRRHWDAVAGAGGARKVYEALVEKLTPGAANVEKLRAEFLGRQASKKRDVPTSAAAKVTPIRSNGKPKARR